MSTELAATPSKAVSVNGRGGRIPDLSADWSPLSAGFWLGILSPTCRGDPRRPSCASFGVFSCRGRGRPFCPSFGDVSYRRDSAD